MRPVPQARPTKTAQMITVCSWSLSVSFSGIVLTMASAKYRGAAMSRSTVRPWAPFDTMGTNIAKTVTDSSSETKTCAIRVAATPRVPTRGQRPVSAAKKQSRKSTIASARVRFPSMLGNASLYM